MATFTESADGRPSERQMAAAREWDALVEQVRTLDGFSDFLKPPEIKHLLPAAAGGPVAIINVSQSRCDALLVTSNGVQINRLSQLTAQDVKIQTKAYLAALAAVHQAAWQRHRLLQVPTASTTGFNEALRDVQATTADRDRRLLDVLEWLWDTIAAPVLKQLGYTQPPADGSVWPRIWWCPTGLLTLLPLHAAGYHRDTSQQQTAIDRVVSSYTPTLRALMKARQTRVSAPDTDRMLVVAVGSAPNEIPLPAVDRECDTLKSLFPERYTMLEGPQAIIAHVQAQLTSHRWVHFGCHGDQDLNDPSKGGLVLHDGTLDIAAVSRIPDGGDFAFLGACNTATGGLELPDEATNLTAALHYAGYRHVIGTLWSVYDDTTADLAEAIYSDLTANGQFEPQRAAYALHRAVRALRKTNPIGATAWTPYTHTGP